MSTPQISVCIPTFNRGTRLLNIIDILLRSDFPDFEIVVSDDASTDNTRELLAGIKDKRVRVIPQPVNIGIWPNWNMVVSHAAAPLIFRMDDDDYIAPSFLGKMVALFARHPEIKSAYAGFAYTRGYDFTTFATVVDQGIFSGHEVREGSDLIASFLLHNPFPGIHPASVVYRKTAGEEVGFYRDDFNDHTFALALAACGKVGYIPEPLFFYVKHDDPRASNALGVDPLTKIRTYDPLRVAKGVYGSTFAPLRELPALLAIKKQVFKKHLRLYPCINLFTVRNNFHKIRLVYQSAWYMARQYPSILFYWKTWFCLIWMSFPMRMVNWLMRIYRNKKR